ncbi:MAG: Ppx/GppA family phosphatase, partial [Leptonema sp. (in: Bacteria)]|nr:Ppx/GppA family phosphatase [Leptonema sp. (in: bacteria)]
MKRPIAAIDIGTNSIHMIVAQSDSDGQIQALDREQQSVRLGSGGDSFDLIRPDAEERAIATLKGFAQIAHSHNAVIYAVSTSAVREAKNQSDFLRRVKRDCGIKVTVIPGQEEARLIYLGILQNLPVFEKRILMIDIGGGSTEYLIGQKRVPEFIQSLKLGAIRTTERFFANGEVNSKSINAARTFLRYRLESMKALMPSLDFETVVGSSGTIKTILELISQNRNSNIITRNDLDKIVDRLLSIKSAQERLKLLSLPEKRADIIVGGALILQESFRMLEIDQMIYSPFALREGVVYEILLRKNKKDDLNQIRKRSVLSLAKKFLNRTGQDDTPRISNLILLALYEIQKAHLVDQDLLEYGSILHNIGLTISHAGHHKHSMYIIQNSDTLLGFNSREINFIAALTRYHRKTSP